MHAADAQSGMITRSQALDVGIEPAEFDNAFIEAGLLQVVIPGVARVRAGGRHPFPRQFARWLLLQPHELATDRQLPESGVVSGATALRIHKVIDLPGDTEFTAAPGSELAQVPETALTLGQFAAGDWSTVQGLPVATAGHAFADVAASGRLDYAELGRIADRILQAGLADEGELAGRLETVWPETSERDGRAMLHELLDASEAAADTGA